MVIAGVDPSLSRCGIVILESNEGGTTLIYNKTLSTPVALTPQERVAVLAQRVYSLFKSFGVEKVAIETQYMGRANPSSIIKLAMGAGAIIGVCGVLEIEVVGVPPLKALRAVCAADKSEVPHAVQRWLKIGLLNEHESAAAAMAAAALTPTLPLSLD